MGYEIERKFLVDGDYRTHSFERFIIKQGYLSLSGTSVIRVRVNGEKAFLTVKSASEEGGIKRNEWEYEIPVGDAEEMLLLCEGAVIDKIRYLINYEGHLFEVDEFYGSNEGLVIAEIELEEEDEPFEKPDWLRGEVTGDIRYYNSSLSMHPYKEWDAK
ncbi:MULTISPECIES: CYTH domain-containing protein [Proteiniphilum]|jgi:CYTH domain-containing protein|uniref:CYTH domain-containing protein n=1 Tax=Proteiniphilum TaxID=294702 RepID=UPI001EEB9472|nr:MULTISPECIES: CYTH domain-containing protein [Proteiniphilum]ULB35213.1 CYTH domain-containing protein [Proteiniphilum propionicum]